LRGQELPVLALGVAQACGTFVPFFDRENESRRIEEALRRKESMMICGPAGIGKTTIILNVIHHLPAKLSRQCLYLAGFKDLQDLLRMLVEKLYRARNPELRRELRGEGVTVTNFGVWLKSLPRSRLRGMLYRAVENSDYRIILDHGTPFTHGMAKVIKELFWMRNTPVCLLMRDDSTLRPARFTRFFYWSDRERLILEPLPAHSAKDLLESCIERFGLTRYDLGEFRKEVLGLSRCVPGAIVKMCALAADPWYQYGARIKAKLVHIDYLMSGKESHPSSTRKKRPAGSHGGSWAPKNRW
jgi:nucleoside-triphosphatase THEP1